MTTSARDQRPYRRAREDMPGFVEDALNQRGLMSAYRARPPYQQNDYLLWIRSARRHATKQKRLAQMLDELERGDSYMNMSWRPSQGVLERATSGPS